MVEWRKILVNVVSIFVGLMLGCSDSSDLTSDATSKIQIDTGSVVGPILEESHWESDSLNFLQGTATQERVYMEFDYRIDVGTAEFIPLRKRPITEDEVAHSNKGGQDASEFNNHLVIKYLHNDELVELTDSSNRFYKVRVMDYNGIAEGYILKSIKGRTALKPITVRRESLDKIVPFCKTFLTEKFVDLVKNTKGNGKEKFVSALHHTHQEDLMFKVFLGASKRYTAPSNTAGGDFSKYVNISSNDYFFYPVLNSSQTFMLADQPPDLIRFYDVRKDTLFIDVMTWSAIGRPETISHKLYPVDKLDPYSKRWVLNDSVSLIDISTFDNQCVNPSDTDIDYCLRILDSYLMNRIQSRTSGYVDNYLAWTNEYYNSK